MESTVNYLSSTVDVFPDLFGFTKVKKYLILFQNNMELRPGGGFIGSFGILTMNRGRVAEFQIHDVYEADGQLKGHIEPSFPIRRYMPLVHLYLRDSNFNVDYSKGASVSAFMLNEEMNVMVDGVIATDVTFVKNLLKDIGPVYVPDYKETVKADNLYMLTQSHAEKNFFPGSSQKKDFLRSLFTAIQINLNTRKNISLSGFFKNIGEAVEQKHLLFAFSDSNIQNLFSVNGMSSSILHTRQDGVRAINDFIGINDANIGSNKANYYIKRKIVQNVSMDNDGSVSERLSVIYMNDSKTNVWPGGDYKNYVRFVLPKGAILKTVIVDGSEQKIVPAVTDPAIYEKKNFKPSKGLEVETYDQDGKTVYGFLFIAPSSKFTTISIFYSLKNKISLNGGVNAYDVKVFKQPGTDEDLYSLILDFPKELSLLKFEDNSSTDGQLKSDKDRVEYQTKLLKDINLHVSLTRE
ncbi:MAG: DUF4012 domain-containing protein [Actinobacteria bacterium]|nr:DUF4012 domain-containing protein [Actinomycetota bacterium]